EDLGTGGFCRLLAALVADVLEQTALVLQFEVVPVLATNKGAAIAIAQLKVMHTLENLGEGLSLLEVQPTIIAGLGIASTTVSFTDQVHITTSHGPAGTNRHGRVELPLKLPDIEIDGISRCSSAQRSEEHTSEL